MDVIYTSVKRHGTVSILTLPVSYYTPNPKPNHHKEHICMAYM